MRSDGAPPKKPAHVVTIPVVIRGEYNDGTSSDEDSGENTFREEQFKDPLTSFQVSPAKSSFGMLEEHELPAKREVKSYSPTVRKLENIFSTQAFGETAAISVRETSERLRLCLLLNSVRSVSSRKNRKLLKSMKISSASTWMVCVGLYWQLPLEEKNAAGNWQKITYKRVRDFYKQLKCRDAELAETFVTTLENNLYFKVPYRALRERIKNHEITKKQIADLRDASYKHIYLGIFDSDLLNLRPDKVGIFSHFDQWIQANLARHGKPLELASGGYSVPETDPDTKKHQPILAFAVLLDLVFRHKTAQRFPNGVYFPEPGSIVRVKPGEPTVRESFLSAPDGSGVGNGSAASEMNVLRENLKQHRTMDITTVRFDQEAHFDITAPKRFEKKFSASTNSEGQIIDWSLKALKEMRDTAQSHWKSKQWRDSLLHHFAIPKEAQIFLEEEEYRLKNKNETRSILLIILAIFYNHYDPIRIAEQLAAGSDATFTEGFIDVLKTYDPSEFTLTDNAEAEDEEKGGKDFVALRTQIRKITDIAELDGIIDSILGEEVATQIHEAIKAAHSAVIEKISDRFLLEYKDLTVKLMSDLLNEVLEKSTDEKIKIVLTELPPLHQKIVGRKLPANQKKRNSENIFPLSRDEKTLIDSRNTPSKKDSNGFSPMHWAAISGQSDVILSLRAQSTSFTQWIGRVDVPANGGILPIHCALIYCAAQGYKKELISNLLSDATLSTVNAAMADGRTPLYLAITEFDDSFKIVKKLIKNYYAEIDVAHLETYLSILCKEENFDEYWEIMCQASMYEITPEGKELRGGLSLETIIPTQYGKMSVAFCMLMHTTDEADIEIIFRIEEEKAGNDWNGDIWEDYFFPKILSEDFANIVEDPEQYLSMLFSDERCVERITSMMEDGGSTGFCNLIEMIQRYPRVDWEMMPWYPDPSSIEEHVPRGKTLATCTRKEIRNAKMMALAKQYGFPITQKELNDHLDSLDESSSSASDENETSEPSAMRMRIF